MFYAQFEYQVPGALVYVSPRSYLRTELPRQYMIVLQRPVWQATVDKLRALPNVTEVRASAGIRDIIYT